jgi:anti-sigma factor RsiW
MRVFAFRRPKELSDDEPAQLEPAHLAALADGTLDPWAGSALRARVAGSPELAGLLDEQRRSLALVRGASASVAAPAGLRARVEAERRRPRRRASVRNGLVLGAGLAAAAAALALVLVPGGAAPTVAAAAVFSTRGATGAAPALQPGQPKLLARAVGGVRFPNWREQFGWHATGARADRLSGRDTGTVFYQKDGRRLGYTIVAGPSLPPPPGATQFVRGGTNLRVFTVNGRVVVTWRRGGRTCVLVGSGVTRHVLLELASWNGKGAVPF